MILLNYYDHSAPASTCQHPPPEASFPRQYASFTLLFPPTALCIQGASKQRSAWAARWNRLVWLPLGNHRALSCHSLEGLYELGRSISQNTRGRRKWLLKVTSLSVGGLHLHPEILTPGPTTSRGQERLPGGRGRIQGRGVSQAVGARRATKGIPGSQGLGHGAEWPGRVGDLGAP